MSTRSPLRNVRVPEPLWQAAKAGAEQEGVTISALINRMLLERFGRDLPHHFVIRGKNLYCVYCGKSEASLRAQLDGADPAEQVCT